MSKYQAYSEYKDTGIDWLPKVPTCWHVLPLKLVLMNKVKDGPHETPVFIEDGIPFLSVDGIQDGKLVFEGCRYISQEDHERYAKKCLPKYGDILLGKAASVGKVAFVDTEQEFNVWSPLAVLTPKSVKYGKFLYYSLQSTWLQAQCDVSSNSNTQKNLSMGVIDNLSFPIPVDSVAEKIASFLDHETAKIDTLIDKQQQLIQLLKEKRQAVISHAVTKGLNPNAPMRDSGVEWLGEVPEHWILARLKNVLRIRNGRDYKDVEVEDGGYPVYGSGGIFKRSSNYLYDGKSVLFGRKGTIDKPLVVSGKFWTVDTMFYSEVFDNALPEYIYYQAIFFPFSLLSTNTALPSMTQEDLLMLPFVIPPNKEQESIVRHVQDKTAKFDYLINKAQSAIEFMQERRTALISAAVTGKIDVRSWVAPSTLSGNIRE